MGLIEDGEKWLWTVALRKAVAAALGFLASKQAIVGIAWLEAHGVHLSIDTAKFQTEMTVAGIGGFTALHDWLKLKYPDFKYL